jgi:hypothetical protein
LILCALMNLNISAPSVNLSVSMLFRILHGGNIVIKCLSVSRSCVRKLCSIPSTDKTNNVTMPPHIISFIYVYNIIRFVCSSLATMFDLMVA